MPIEEELSFVAEKVLGRIGKIPTKIYKESYEAIHGEGSCALTCEIDVNSAFTIRIALDYKSNKKLLGSNISIIGGHPITSTMILEDEGHEEQLRNFSSIIIIELYNFLQKVAKVQQTDTNKTRGIMSRLKKSLNEI